MGILILLLAAALFLPVVAVILLPLLTLVAALFRANKKPAATEQASRNGQASRTHHAQPLPAPTLRAGE